MLAQSQVFATSTGSIEILMPEDFHDTVQPTQYDTVDSTVTVDGKTYEVDAFATPFAPARRIYRLKVSEEAEPLRYFYAVMRSTHQHSCFSFAHTTYPSFVELNKKAQANTRTSDTFVPMNVTELTREDYESFISTANQPQ